MAGDRRRRERPVDADSLLLRRALRRLRREAGLTGSEAAKLFGITVSNLSRAESGHRYPFSAFRMANAFGVPLGNVLDPCPVCGYAPEHGFMCLHCGTSELDAYRCPSCPRTAGTVYEINDHAIRAHTIGATVDH